MTPAGILVAALTADLMLGDPLWLFHPIRWFGSVISFAENRLRRAPVPAFSAGLFMTLFLVTCVFSLCRLLVTAAEALHPLAGWGMQAVMIFYALSIRSLNGAVREVRIAFLSEGIGVARRRLSFIVGRETASLDRAGICRASIETLAENFVDGVVSPLFYAVMGGGPLALAYKMVNTLDSMIGYRNQTYIQFGKAAARLDDAANFFPARLAVLFIALAARMCGMDAWQTVKRASREGFNHASPNAGYPEAAFSGALSIRLGGGSTYHGTWVEKPFIGPSDKDPDLHDIKRAERLFQAAALLAAVSGILAGLV
ncbi:MAG: cobalamin biosynthesis protein CobD [Deltaproteobacteria bacterium]|nr:MAG: cobalamin biosynthesis protein CobD [Deltaproteobacteria bacterium]